MASSCAASGWRRRAPPISGGPSAWPSPKDIRSPTSSGSSRRRGRSCPSCWTSSSPKAARTNTSSSSPTSTTRPCSDSRSCPTAPCSCRRHTTSRPSALPLTARCSTRPARSRSIPRRSARWCIASSATDACPTRSSASASTWRPRRRASASAPRTASRVHSFSMSAVSSRARVATSCSITSGAGASSTRRETVRRWSSPGTRRCRSRTVPTSVMSDT